MVLKIILIVIGLIMVFGVIPTFLLSHIIYRKLLVRENPDKRERRCSFPDEPEYVLMYNEGLEWGQKHDGCRHSVDVISDGLHLYGEYFDFGSDKAVIIIPGRTEDCTYSYYFADPFYRAGCNVLCIDNRSHGLSDGKCHRMGSAEFNDILKWSELLVNKFGNKKVLLHGICIGASVAINTLTLPNCPDYLVAMTCEGMFTNFKASFDEHMKEGHHPRFPFTMWVMAWIRIQSGANVWTDGPYKKIGLLKKPILMLHSKEDPYSLPEQAEWLYENCTAPKQIVWFEHGEHSRIRPVNKELFDKSIMDFVEKVL